MSEELELANPGAGRGITLRGVRAPDVGPRHGARHRLRRAGPAARIAIPPDRRPTTVVTGCRVCRRWLPKARSTAIYARLTNRGQWMKEGKIFSFYNSL